MSHLKPVTISYSALAFDGKKEDLQQQVFHALGTHKGALGIVLISGKYSAFDEGGNELINVCRSSSSIPLSSRETLPISSPSCKYARKRTGKARKARNVLHVWLVPWQGDHEWGEYKGNSGCKLLLTQSIASRHTKGLILRQSAHGLSNCLRRNSAGIPGILCRKHLAKRNVRPRGFRADIQRVS